LTGILLTGIERLVFNSSKEKPFKGSFLIIAMEVVMLFSFNDVNKNDAKVHVSVPKGLTNALGLITLFTH
jgi:hypothetical protein